jgi:hypothetical protein
MQRLQRRVLQAIIQQTSPKQSKWVSKKTLKITLVAHGGLTIDDLDDELDALEQDGLIHCTPDDEYRPTSDAEISYD